MVRNVQQRLLPDVSSETAGPLLDSLSGPDDRVWPRATWPAIRFDRPLSVGADGGHKPIRYWVSRYEPGHRLHFSFHPEIGLLGHHKLEVIACPGGTVVRHVLEARLSGQMRLLWPLAIRWMHEALLNDLLDRFEHEATGTVRRPSRWSAWVKLCRSVIAKKAPTPRSPAMFR